MASFGDMDWYEPSTSEQRTASLIGKLIGRSRGELSRERIRAVAQRAWRSIYAENKRRARCTDATADEVLLETISEIYSLSSWLEPGVQELFVYCAMPFSPQNAMPREVAQRVATLGAV